MTLFLATHYRKRRPGVSRWLPSMCGGALELGQGDGGRGGDLFSFSFSSHFFRGDFFNFFGGDILFLLVFSTAGALVVIKV